MSVEYRIHEYEYPDDYYDGWDDPIIITNDDSADFYFNADIFGNDGSDILYEIFRKTRIIESKLTVPTNYIAVIGMITNFFHLVVLSRKSMRTTSTNIMMIGISIFDVICMITLFCNNMFMGDTFDYDDCTEPQDYYVAETYHILDVVRYTFRRTSLWLVIFMTSVRWVSIKFPTSLKADTLTKPNIGWVAQVIAVLIISPLMLMYHFQLIMVAHIIWKPASYCEGFPENYTKPFYSMGGFWADQDQALKIGSYADAILSKIIPCCLLPAITLLLVIELRKASSARKMMSNNNAKKGDLTTKIVIAIAITYIIVEIPSTFLLFAKALYSEVYGFWRMTESANAMIWPAYLFNGSLHCIICFLMSTQYRNTVKNILKLDGPKFKNSTSSVVTTVTNKSLTSTSRA